MDARFMPPCALRRFSVLTIAAVVAALLPGLSVAGAASATGPSEPTRTPSVSLDKSVVDSNDAGTAASVGETLTYTFTVTNTGNVALAHITITDAKLGMSNVPCVANLAVGATATCPTQSYVVSESDVLAGQVDNTATVTASPSLPAGSGDVCSDLEGGKVDTPGMGSSFTVTAPPGQLISGYCVKAGSSEAGDGPVYVVVDPPKTSVTMSHPSGKDVSHYSLSFAVTDSDSAEISTEILAPSTPGIALEKSVADSNDADSVGSLGETLTYSFQVTNTGNVPLTNVTISDPMFSLTNAPCVASLAVGASTSCPLLPTQTHTVTATDVAHGSVDNTATTKGTPPTGPDVSDQDDATIPTVSDDGEASISIEKTADVTVAAPGDEVTYTLRVVNNGDADAEDVVITDMLPSGTTYVSSSAPCTNAGSTVTCELGTLAAGEDREVTITVRVNPVGNGDTSHNHHLDYTKTEAHIASFDGDTTTATADCPQGYIATDGSVRLDHVDQGAGTFEDVVVLASGATANGRGWTGTIRNDTVGQVQAKVNVVCMTDKTTSGENHSHPVQVAGPVSTSQTFASGRHDVDLTCGAGTWAITPSFAFSSGEGVVTTRRTASGWRFIVDVDDAAQGTFSVRCLSTALGTVSGHSHDLRFEELSDTVSVPAGQIVERSLTCRGDYKGIVAWADLDPGLVPLGNDPQPVTRVFRFYNPTGSALTARYGLLCVAIRTNGGNQGDSEIKNTASVSTSSPDADNGDNSDSATVSVTATGVDVAPKVSVVSSAGKTKVELKLSSSGRKTATFRLLATRQVKGTSLKAGSTLATSKTRLKAGQATVRMVARGAAGTAIRKGKVTRAKLVITVGKHRSVRVVKLR